MSVLTLLGTGAGMGTPGFCCGCGGCLEAKVNKKAARTRCGVHISAKGESILIDTPPDLRRQLLREGIASVDKIFYTHWHWDHFGGLGELEYYIKLHRKSPVDVYLTPDAREDLPVTYPNMEEVLNLHRLEFGQTEVAGGLSITPYPAVHGHIETAGYLIEGTKTAAYFPDTTDRLSGPTLEAIHGVDYFICDCSFFGENIFPGSHMNMEQAAALGRKISARNIIFTHHGIHYSALKTLAEMEKAIKIYPGASIGFDGWRTEI